MDDLEKRITERPQISTDGLKAYREAVWEAFGPDVDFAQIIKGSTGREPTTTSGSTAQRRAPAWTRLWCRERRTWTRRTPATSSGHNLSMRMGMRRFTRLTNAFSKKLEKHCAMLALYFHMYNWIKPPRIAEDEAGQPGNAGDGGGDREAAGDDGAVGGADRRAGAGGQLRAKVPAPEKGKVKWYTTRRKTIIPNLLSTVYAGTAMRMLLKRFTGRITLTLGLVVLEAIGWTLFPLVIGRAINSAIAGTTGGIYEFAGLGIIVMVIAGGRRMVDSRAYGRIFIILGKELVGRESKRSTSATTARIGMLREIVQFFEDDLPQLISQHDRSGRDNWHPMGAEPDGRPRVPRRRRRHGGALRHDRQTDDTLQQGTQRRTGAAG